MNRYETCWFAVDWPLSGCLYVRFGSFRGIIGWYYPGKDDRGVLYVWPPRGTLKPGRCGHPSDRLRSVDRHEVRVLGFGIGAA